MGASVIDLLFATEGIAKFACCESDERAAGSPSSRAIWFFGIAPEAASDACSAIPARPGSGSHAREMQRGVYQRRALKLLAAVNGYRVEEFARFAGNERPFVAGGRGYFKGNLYPFPYQARHAWAEPAVTRTGTADKREYERWCVDLRLPAIKAWVDEYRPRIFIGVGIRWRQDFSKAVFGDARSLAEETLTVNNHGKRLLYAADGWRKLVVVPHFSGPNGLNSNASLQIAGGFIRDMMQSP